MKNFEKQKGNFWLPNSPDHKVKGEFELVYETLGILTLYDVIDASIKPDVYFNEYYERMQHPLIIGLLDNNECVALLQSSFYSITFKVKYEYSINVTIFTSPFLINSENDLKFKKISFSFDNLPQYLGSCDVKKSSDLPRSVSVKYTNITDSFNLSNELFCKINYTFNCSFSYLPVTQITPITIIDLELSSEQDIFQWLKLIDNNISSFFSIIVGKYLCPIMIKAQIEYESQCYKFPVYYRYFNNHSNMFYNKRLCLQKMIPELKEYMYKFYDFSQKYPLIINNYMILYKFEAVLEYQFLLAVYAVETFSRYFNQNHYYFPEDEFQKKVVKPLNNFIDNKMREGNQNYVERLKTAIKYSNEISLRSIIKQLFDENKDILSQIINEDLRTLNAKIVDTRNWYTHFSKELETKAAKGYELYQLLIRVRILFEICLFRNLKMSDEHIISTIKSTYLLD